MIITNALVVGTIFRDENLVRVAAEAAKLLSDSNPACNVFTVTRDPDNPHDCNALKVEYCGELFGFIAANQAARITELLNRRGYNNIKVKDITVYEGGETNYPGFRVTLDVS